MSIDVDLGITSDAVVHEALRIHPNVGLILERLVPPDGTVIDGYHLPGGAVVGVNAWNIHFRPELYGDNTFEFRPGRWLESPEEKVKEMKRNLFSVCGLTTFNISTNPKSSSERVLVVVLGVIWPCSRFTKWCSNFIVVLMPAWSTRKGSGRSKEAGLRSRLESI